MKTLLKIISSLALAGMLAAAAAFFLDALPLVRAQGWMLLATVAWFASAPFWMEHTARG
jgi:hypothetical protein